MEEKIIRATVKAEPKYNVGRTINLASYEAVKVFKSVRRAQSRGHVTPWGTIAPKRPFNNRKRTSGRELQITKEKIYGELKYRSQAS